MVSWKIARLEMFSGGETTKVLKVLGQTITRDHIYIYVTALFYQHMIYLVNYVFLRRLTYCQDVTKKASNMETLPHSWARDIFLRVWSDDELPDFRTVCVQRHQQVKGFPLRTVAVTKRGPRMSSTLRWCKQYFGGYRERGKMSKDWLPIIGCDHENTT